MRRRRPEQMPLQSNPQIALARVLVSALVFLAASGQCLSQTASVRQGGVIRGLVKSGNMPLPGVTITATNTLTGQKSTTWTDVTGNYSLQVSANGRYVVRAQMAAFAPQTQEVLINATNQDAKMDLEMILLSRVPQVAPQDQQQAAAMGSRGFQSLTVAQGEGAAGYTGNASNEQSGGSMPGSEVSAATESVS